MLLDFTIIPFNRNIYPQKYNENNTDPLGRGDSIRGWFNTTQI